MVPQAPTEPLFRGRSAARAALRRAGRRGTRESAPGRRGADLRRWADRPVGAALRARGWRVSARHHRSRRGASRVRRVARFFFFFFLVVLVAAIIIIIIIGRTPARAHAARSARRGQGGSRGADRRRDGGHGARRRARMHGRGVLDRGRDRGGPVRRDGVRGGRREERDGVPVYADVDEGGGRPVPVPVREHVAAGDPARGGERAERRAEAGHASVSDRGGRASVRDERGPEERGDKGADHESRSVGFGRVGLASECNCGQAF